MQDVEQLQCSTKLINILRTSLCKHTSDKMAEVCLRYFQKLPEILSQNQSKLHLTQTKRSNSNSEKSSIQNETIQK